MTYIIRHSERMDHYDEERWKNMQRYYTNPLDPPITERGIYIAKDASQRILNDIGHNIGSYKYIYTSPFARCIETAIIISATIEYMTNHLLLIRIDNALRELHLIPFKQLMDDLMTKEQLLCTYVKHLQRFDTTYDSLISFNDVSHTSLNVIEELTRFIDAFNRIKDVDRFSIICTHGLNILELGIVKMDDIHTLTHGDCHGSSLESYCHIKKLP